MALQSIIEINADFYDKKYTLINAKQLDRNSRFLLVTCYNQGKIMPISAGEHSAYIRYKKADGHSVFNSCTINAQRKILVELTEQMLASDGICCADLIIVNKGGAQINANGEITYINNSSILSTMTFYIDVCEIPVDNSDIESTYEFGVLNQTLEKYEANYKEVVKMARSWAEGGTGIRDGENEKNAKYYAELALKNAYGGDSIVTGVRGSNETSYRNGQVTISAYNVGAVPEGTAVLYTDVATVSEVKGFLGIT
jgi:hypothetical protein